MDAVNDTPVPTFAINQVASEAGELVTGQLAADDIEIGTGEELATSLTYAPVRRSDCWIGASMPMDLRL